MFGYMSNWTRKGDQSDGDPEDQDNGVDGHVLFKGNKVRLEELCKPGMAKVGLHLSLPFDTVWM